MERIPKSGLYYPNRVAHIYLKALEDVMGHNGGPLGPESVKLIFERIIDEMRVVQRIRMEGKQKGNG